MAEPSLKVTWTIDDLLGMLNDELHGKKNAFSEAQKIRHINKAVDATWVVTKGLHRNYWLKNAPLTLDLVSTDFTLPADYAEMRLIEVTAPQDFAGLDYIKTEMTSALFRTERQSTLAQAGAGSSDASIAIPGQMNYDIYGPDVAGLQHILFSRLQPATITLRLWYIRYLPQFSMPKVGGESLATLMSPFVWDLVVYAAKSLLKSEGTNPAEYQKWESEWRESIDRALPAAGDRQTADVDTVEGFIEL